MLYNAIRDLDFNTSVFIKQLIDEVWPVGSGFKLDNQIGATFGIPIAIDSDANFYIWRESEKELKVLRRGVIGAGLDLGVGVGAWFGVGKVPRKLRPDNDTQRTGFAAELAANFQLGGQVMSDRETASQIAENLLKQEEVSRA